MSTLLLNKNTQKFLEQQLNPETRLSQSMLFYGGEHLGKFYIAQIFAKSILCKKHQWQGCNECDSCKAINHNWHPDFKIFQPTSNSIKIEEISDLKNFLMYKPQLSENRILIIDEAHKLTPEAESSLLKILEEPSINSIIILVTPFPNQLMPTILSRLLPVRFAKEPDESLKNFLINIYQIPHEQLTLYLELGQNKIGEIFQLINNPEYLNTKISNIRIFIDLLNSNFVEATNIIQNITNKDEYNLAQLVNDWLGFLQQILVYKNIDFWNKYLKTDLSLLLSNSTLIKQLLKNVLQLYNYTTNYNLNKKLMLENFYLAIH